MTRVRWTRRAYDVAAVVLILATIALTWALMWLAIPH